MNTFSKRIIADYATLQAKGKDSAVREASIRRLQRLIVPHLGRGRQHALDLGAGQGELVEALQRLGYSSVQGVELSESQVHQAKLHGCTVEPGDALAFLQAKPDASLDLVTCFDVFEHLPHPVCAAWFEQIARVLRPGGRAD